MIEPQRFSRAPPPAHAPPRAVPTPPAIGMISRGCLRALVDSERILTRLRAERFAIAPDYNGADLVIVSTCGFLDSGRAESLGAIAEALEAMGRVTVTRCLGAEAETVSAAHPKVLATTGPRRQYEAVMDAVPAAVPPWLDPKFDLIPPQGVKRAPLHHAYLKISEGCDHGCRFCIILAMRGKLASGPATAVLPEAERLVGAGVYELLVISQDISAYGPDLRHAESAWRAARWRAHITGFARGLGSLGAWVRLHYAHPFPHVDHLMPLMAEGLIIPSLHIPFQHAALSVLRAMRRAADEAKVVRRLARWRQIFPESALLSTFIIGLPGESEADFQHLLDWSEEAQRDRVGCFQYEDVVGAAANDLPGHVAEEVKEDGTLCRTCSDAPEIDGNLFMEDAGTVSPGDILTVEVTEASDYDLWDRVA